MSEHTPQSRAGAIVHAHVLTEGGWIPVGMGASRVHVPSRGDRHFAVWHRVWSGRWLKPHRGSADLSLLQSGQ